MIRHSGPYQPVVSHNDYDDNILPHTRPPSLDRSFRAGLVAALGRVRPAGSFRFGLACRGGCALGASWSVRYFGSALFTPMAYPSGGAHLFVVAQVFLGATGI